MREGSGQLFTRLPPLIPVPRLTKDLHRVVVALEAGAPLEGAGVTRLLRWLIRHRCVVVMGVSPGRYCVTKMGRVVMRLGLRR